MKDIRIRWSDIAVGNNITLWRLLDGYSGQGGTVLSVSPTSVDMV